MPISTVSQKGLDAPLTLANPVLTAPNLGTPSAINLANAVFSAGAVLQVVSTTKTDTFSTTSTTFTDVTGLSVSITPKFSTSKIYVSFTSNMTADVANSGFQARLVRNSTPICVGDAAASRPQSSVGGSSLNTFIAVNVTNQFLDSPATTSATTYKVQMFNSAGTTSYVNRTQGDRNTTVADARYASTITVMEIAG